MDSTSDSDKQQELTDLSRKCRICLQSGSEMNSFFDIYYEDLTLANVFKTITSYEVSEDDRLPKNICESCSEVVINFNNMISVFQENEEYLNKLICQTRVQFTEDREYVGVDSEVEFINTNCLENNENLEKIEYFDESNLDSVVEYGGVEETIEDEGESRSSPENCDENYSSEKHIEEPDPNDEIKENVKKQYHKSEPYIDKYEIIENGEYNRVQTVKYTCDCGDCFLHKAGFRQHMQSKHNTTVEEGDLDKYTTEIKLKIPTGFPTNIEYVPSRITVRKNKLQCRICTLCFSSPIEVKQHEEIHKTHVCHHCGAAFLKKHYLTDHLHIHSEDRHYKCKICGKTFRHRHTLSVHRKTHDVARSFVCETCGAGFRARCTLYTHKRLKHTNERNFPCTACNLRFNLKSTLDKHYSRKHTSNREKKFVCTKCGAAYLNKTTLTRHVAEKHLGKAKTYPCNICENKVYVMKKSLGAHLQNKHNIF
nr:zinc finger protein 484-like [Leptinotarsa decemlineata]